MALSRALRDVIRKENGMVSKGKPSASPENKTGMTKKPTMNADKKSK